MTESVVLCSVLWDCSETTRHFSMLPDCTVQQCESPATEDTSCARLSQGVFYTVPCAGVKFGCQQLAVARVLVQLVAIKPKCTAIFDINTRRDKHFTTCFFIELAPGVRE